MTRNLIALSLTSLLLACGGPDDVDETDAGNDNNDDKPVLVERATVDGDRFSAKLLSEKPLAVGRHLVHYRVTDKATGELVTDATVTHLPTMHMAMGNSHSSPFVEPVLVEDDWVGEVVFIMAGGGTWDISLTVTRGEDDPETLTFVSVPVAESTARKDLVVGDSKYLLTLNFDEPPHVGLNTFVLTAHERAGMEGGFPAVTDFAITVTPEMPTMGHGSSGNVDPVHDANGNYRGTVNLTMSGLWTLDFAVSQGGTELGVVQYSLEL